MRLWNLCAAMLAAIALLVVATPARAAAFFVDTTLGDVPPEQKVPVAEPRPVQLLFQFTTNGSANGRATNYLKDQITELVQASGLFSAVSVDPVEGGAILSVTINNIVQQDAARQGFTAGLTFGLNGTVVADRYESSIAYVNGPDAERLTKTSQHTLYTRIGRDGDPPNAVRVRNVDEGVRTVTRQMLDHMLTALARDQAFNPNAPAAAVVAAPTPAASVPASATEQPAAAPATAP